MSSSSPSSDAGPVRPRFQGNPVIHVTLSAAVCLFAYSNTFHVPFRFDDQRNIDGKPFVRDIGIFFDPARLSEDSVFIMRPVTYFTFALNYRLHGTDVVGYHVVNLVIHILNTAVSEQKNV